MLARVNRGAPNAAVCPVEDACGEEGLGVVPAGVAVEHAARRRLKPNRRERARLASRFPFMAALTPGYPFRFGVRWPDQGGGNDGEVCGDRRLPGGSVGK